MQVQLTITLALIAAAAAVALICDFMRARNAQLRKAMAELEARNQAREQARKAADERKAMPRFETSSQGKPSKRDRRERERLRGRA